MTRVRNWTKANKRSIIKWAIVAFVVVIIAIPAIVGSDSSTPYDPKSTKPDGTKAFAMLMQQAGADFSIGDRPATGTAVLLDDNLSNDEAKQVENWVQDGGTLIVADQQSSLAVSTTINSPSVAPIVLQPKCTAPYATNVTNIRPNTTALYSLFQHDSKTTTECFPVKGGYFVMTHTEGDGTVIDVGSPDIFTNQDLANYDNAVLVTNLVQPKTGQNIVYLKTNDAAAASGDSSGGESLSQLLPHRVKEALVQLLIAAFVLVLWRSRRLGAPVDEDQLVQIPASQLVVATGYLLETAHRSEDAAAMMRNDVKRSFAQLMGVDPNIDDRALVQILHDRTHIQTDRLVGVLYAMPASDNTQLITLAQQIEYLYMEVSRVR